MSGALPPGSDTRPTPDAFITYQGQSGRRTSPVFWNKTFGVRLDVMDEASPYLFGLAERFPKEFARAIRSFGFELRKAMVRNIQSGGPRSAKWKALSGIRDVPAAVPKGTKLSKTRARGFYGQIGRSGGVRGKSPLAYVYSKAPLGVVVGWMGYEARARAVQLQTGFNVPITTRMRRHFFGSGLAIGKGESSINVPGRPLVYPTWQEEKDAMFRKMELRVHAYVRGSSGKKASAYVKENL